MALVSCWRIRTAFPVPSQPAATRTAPRFWCSRAKGAKTAQPDALVRKADGFSEHLRNSGAGYQAYEQFSQHVVMPMVEAVVKLMAPHLSTKGAALALRVRNVRRSWLHRSFGPKDNLSWHFICIANCHSEASYIKGNPEIIHLAELIGRTPDAVAMKLVNFASLDPAITSTGRSGLKVLPNSFQFGITQGNLC